MSKVIKQAMGMNVVTDDDFVERNHIVKSNDCLKKIVCESCPFYGNPERNNIWNCMKRKQFVTKGFGIKINGKMKFKDAEVGELMHQGMPIPDFCDRGFEHMVITQDWEKSE